MGALANRDFVKMNGLGNEIVIVDLRRAPRARSRQTKRAPPRASEPYDQLMALYPARDGHRRLASASTTTTARRRAPAATACAAWRRWSAPKPARRCWISRRRPGSSRAGARTSGLFTVDMGRPRLRWDEIPLAARRCPIRAPSICNRSPDVAGPAFAVRRQHGQSACDLLGRRSATPTICASIGPHLEHDPTFPRARQHHARRDAARDRVVIRTWERGAGLTKACGSAACAAAVAAARLRRTGRKVTVTLPGGDLAIEWRESDDHVLMTGPGRIRAQGPLRCGAVCRRGCGVHERRCRHLRLPAQCRRIGSDPPRGGARRLHRHGGGQYLRRHRGSGAPGAADHPRAAPRASARQDRRHRLRGADRAANLCRHGRGRSRARQRGKAQRPRPGRRRAPTSVSTTRRRRSSTTSWRSRKPPRI